MSFNVFSHSIKPVTFQTDKHIGLAYPDIPIDIIRYLLQVPIDTLNQIYLKKKLHHRLYREQLLCMICDMQVTHKPSVGL